MMHSILVAYSILLLTCFIELIPLAIFWFRNNWVYKKRMLIISTNYFEYDNYHDYDYMMDHWWIWNIEKFRKAKRTSKD